MWVELGIQAKQQIYKYLHIACTGGYTNVNSIMKWVTLKGFPPYLLPSGMYNTVGRA